MTRCCSSASSDEEPTIYKDCTVGRKFKITLDQIDLSYDPDEALNLSVVVSVKNGINLLGLVVNNSLKI